MPSSAPCRLRQVHVVLLRPTLVVLAGSDKDYEKDFRIRAHFFNCPVSATDDTFILARSRCSATPAVKGSRHFPCNGEAASTELRLEHTAMGRVPGM